MIKRKLTNTDYIKLYTKPEKLKFYPGHNSFHFKNVSFFFSNLKQTYNCN